MFVVGARGGPHVLKFEVSKVLCLEQSVMLRLVSVYCPQSGNGDQQMQKMYDEIQQQCKSKRNRRDVTIIGGDFNLQLRENEEQDITSRHVGHLQLCKNSETTNSYT